MEQRRTGKETDYDIESRDLRTKSRTYHMEQRRTGKETDYDIESRDARYRL